MSERPFWDGQETETLRFADDSIDIRIENSDANIFGSIQFYGRFIYQLILAESDALPTGAEIGYRFTPGSEPIPGEKRPRAVLPQEALPTAADMDYPRHFAWRGWPHAGSSSSR